MIFDSIDNRSLYLTISPRISAALDYLYVTDFSSLEDGRYDIDEDNIFALVQSYESISQEHGKWECHRKYIDIQYIISGAEVIGFGNTNEMESATEYDHEKDIQFLNGDGNFMIVKENSFGIFFPGDAHQPKLAVNNQPGKVKKVVIKIKVN